MDVREFHVILHWILSLIFFLFSISTYTNECPCTESLSGNEFEKHFLNSTGKPSLNVQNGSVYDLCNIEFKLLGIISIMQGMWCLFVSYAYFMVLLKTNKILRHTQIVFENVIDSWRSVNRFSSKRKDTLRYMRRCKGALSYHREHLKMIQNYVFSEVVVLLTLVLNVCSTVFFHWYNNALFFRSRQIWDVYEDSTQTCYREINCFKTHFNYMQDIFTCTYFVYLFIVGIASVIWFNLIETFKAYKRETYWNGIDWPKTVVRLMLAKIPYIIPNYWEFLMLKNVGAIGNEQLLFHVEKNIYNDRYDVFKDIKLR